MFQTCHGACNTCLTNYFLSISFVSSKPFNSIGDIKPTRSLWFGCVLTLAMALKLNSVLLSLMTADLVNPAGVRLP